MSDEESNQSNQKSDQMEEEEDQEIDQYEKDSFMVEDDEEDEMESRRHKKKKHRKKKHREHRESEDDLEEDDYALIEENKAQLEPKKKRLQKMTKNSSKGNKISSDNDEMLSEIDQDIDDSDFDQETNNNNFKQKSSKSNKLKQEHSTLQKKQSQLEDDGFDDDEQDLLEAEEKKYEELKNRFEDAEQIDQNYDNEQDILIRDRDQPERLQIRYQHRDIPKGQELDYETRWIYEQMKEYPEKKQTFNDPNQEPIHLKKIRKVLDFLRVDYYEVMYIQYYKLNEIRPHLSQEDLWTIYNLDEEWAKFSNLKDKLHQDFQRLQEQSSVEIPQSLIENLEKSDNMQQLENLKAYIQFQNFLININLPEEQQVIEKKSISKHWRLLKKLTKFNIGKITEMVTMTPTQLSQNILSSGQGGNRINPQPVSKPPNEMGIDNQSDDDVLVDNPLKILKAISNYGAIEISHYPQIRSFVSIKYRSHVQIFTVPTEKGIKELDVLHPLYPVKRINGCKIDDFYKNFNFLQVQKAEELQLITVKFKLPWEVNQKNSAFNTNNDDIYGQLMNNYIAQVDENQEEFEINKQWNIVRQEIIKILLNNHAYPLCKKQLRKELLERGEKEVAKICSQKFYEQLMTPPWKGQNQDAQQQSEKIMGVFVTQQNHLAIVFLDSKGDVLDHLTLKNYSKRDSLDSQQEKHLLEHDYVKKHKPDLIVVSANSIHSKRIISDLRSFIEKKITQWVTFMDDTIPQMRARKFNDNSQYPEEIQISISLARIMQNPIAEILNLWSETPRQNGCLLIPYHPLQNEISKNRLQIEYEQMAVQAVNEVGVEINHMASFDHQEKMLNFVSGLGPRKAKHILQVLRNDESKYIKTRKQLYEIYRKIQNSEDKPLMEKNVFVNCCGFIRIEEGTKPLDKTRIHSENYVLTEKICEDAFEEEDEHQKGSKTQDYYVKHIMKKPYILEELDFEEYARHLADVKKKDNMIYLLNFIMEELTNPFRDIRGGYKEMPNDKLFYKLSKETPETFKKFSIVSCKVEKINKDVILVKIMDNGLKGKIRVQNTEFFQKEDNRDNVDFQQILERNFHQGDIIKCTVKRINALEKNKEIEKVQDDDIVELSAKKPSSRDWLEAVKQAIPNFNPQETKSALFWVKPEEDFPQFLQNEVQKKNFQMRKINHPKYKYMSLNNTLEYIKDQPNGDFVIRQSSQGPDYLSITWKFYKDNIVHLAVKIEKRQNSVAPVYRMNQEDYECLDEIIERYINPINSLMEQIPQSQKFLDSPMEEIEEKLKEAKKKEPSLIHYFFGCFKHTPQHLVLLYSPKEDQIQKEYIKVKPFGMNFHLQFFTNLPQLIQWFKQNFRSDEYRKHVKKYRNPLFEAEAARLGGNSKGQGLNYQIKQEQVGYVKHEKSEYKREHQNKNVTCTTCNRQGHSANQCFNNKNNSNNHNNNVNCFKCQKPGHIAKNCPNEYSGNNNQNDRNSSFSKQECNICGKIGHSARDCYNKDRSRNRSRSRSKDKYH